MVENKQTVFSRGVKMDRFSLVRLSLLVCMATPVGAGAQFYQAEPVNTGRPASAVDRFLNHINPAEPADLSYQKWIDARFLVGNDGKLAGDLEKFFNSMRAYKEVAALARITPEVKMAVEISDELKSIVLRTKPLDRNGKVTDQQNRAQLIEEILGILYDKDRKPKQAVFAFLRDHPGDDLKFVNTESPALFGPVFSLSGNSMNMASVRSHVRALMIYSVAYVSGTRINEWYRNRLSEALRFQGQPDRWIQPKTYAAQNAKIRPSKVYLDPRALARLLSYKDGMDHVYNYAAAQVAQSYAVAASKVGAAGLATSGASGERVARQILGVEEMAEGKAEKRYFCALTWEKVIEQSYLSVGLKVKATKQAAASEVAYTTPDQLKAGSIKFDQANIYPMPQFLIRNNPDRTGHATGLVVSLDAASMNYKVTRVSFNRTYAEFDRQGYPDKVYAARLGNQPRSTRFAVAGTTFNARAFLASRSRFKAGSAASCDASPVGGTNTSRLPVRH